MSPKPFIPEEAPRPSMRSRGLRGKEQAALRGALNGNGPHAGMSNLERTVTIWGLAGKATPRALAEVLQGFDVSESAKGRMNIIKIPLYVLCSFCWMEAKVLRSSGLKINSR